MNEHQAEASEYASYLQESTSTVRRASLTLYFVGAYMIATSLEVTHHQLLASSQKISLPLVNVPVELTSFYLIAPIIFLAIQAKFLLHLFAHEDRVKSVRKNYVKSKKAWKLASQNILPISLFNLTYGYFRQQYLRLFLSVVYFGMNHAFPIIVLLLFQVSFLPYHHHTLTPLHQCLTIISVVFSSLIYVRGRRPKRTPKAIVKWVWRFWPLIATSLMFVYATVLLDFPQTKLENHKTILFTKIKLNELVTRNIVIENQSLMEQELGAMETANIYYQAMDSLLALTNLGRDPKAEPFETGKLSSSIVENASKSRDVIKQAYEVGVLVEPGRDLRFATFKNVRMRHSVFNEVDLLPKNSAMTRMRFPINLRLRRSQNEEETVQRRTDNRGHQEA